MFTKEQATEIVRRLAGRTDKTLAETIDLAEALSVFSEDEALHLLMRYSYAN